MTQMAASFKWCPKQERVLHFPCGASTSASWTIRHDSVTGIRCISGGKDAVECMGRFNGKNHKEKSKGSGARACDL